MVKYDAVFCLGYRSATMKKFIARCFNRHSVMRLLTAHCKRVEFIKDEGSDLIVDHAHIGYVYCIDGKYGKSKIVFALHSEVPYSGDPNQWQKYHGTNGDQWVDWDHAWKVGPMNRR